jgi:hypothetical protein
VLGTALSERGAVLGLVVENPGSGWYTSGILEIRDRLHKYYRIMYSRGDDETAVRLRIVPA